MTSKRPKPQSKKNAYERTRQSRTPQRKGQQAPSWSQFPPAVLGSLVIRLNELGYAALFGSTSDGGRLTLSLYSDGMRESLYIGRSATVATLLADVGDVVGAVVSSPKSPDALIPAPTTNLGYLEWMRAMKMTEKQIEASCKANGREYVPPKSVPKGLSPSNLTDSP